MLQHKKMLDINLFHKDKGGDPELIRKSLRSRFSNPILVDVVIALDKEECKSSSPGKIFRLIESYTLTVEDRLNLNKFLQDLPESVEVITRDSVLVKIGNLVNESVPVSDDEANNVVVRTWGEKRRIDGNLKNHVDLCRMLDIVAMEKGAAVAGGRGYFLKGDGVLLNQALINFGLQFLRKRGFELLQTPFFMKKETMAKCAQLADFDSKLYKLPGDEEDQDDMYLIATSEQPLCTYHQGDHISPDDLPIRYAGYSTCFRREAGSHGRDTAGIFRVHQFEKIEQFCITSPDNDESWEMLEEMIRNSEDFYKEIGLPYQVVSIVSGALNDAAAKKYDLEAWFPASKTYRELVSCSNCTDYQARRLGITYGEKVNGEDSERFVHLLNSTLTVTTRTLCCILENYQKEDGVEVPEALRPFMGGLDFFLSRSLLIAGMLLSLDQIKSKTN